MRTSHLSAFSDAQYTLKALNLNDSSIIDAFADWLSKESPTLFELWSMKGICLNTPSVLLGELERYAEMFLKAHGVTNPEKLSRRHAHVVFSSEL